MVNRLVLIGAGGHGKVVADIALKNGIQNIVFVDDNAVGECMGFPIIGDSAILETLNDGNTGFVISVGNNSIRKKMASANRDLNWTTLIHPAANIGTDVKIGMGTVIMAGAVINSCASIGQHCIINSCAVIEHDNVLGNFVHISPRAVLGGTVHVGEETHVGIGVVVRNNITICDGCTIGAGAAVVKNITNSGIFVGVPAKIKSK